MVKSQILPIPIKENTYPCIMANTEGPIVLFSENGQGTVINNEGDETHTLGDYRDDWDMGYFEICTSKIELSN